MQQITQENSELKKIIENQNQDLNLGSQEINQKQKEINMLQYQNSYILNKNDNNDQKSFRSQNSQNWFSLILSFKNKFYNVYLINSFN